ncbi:MAG: response regulator, partial [Vicinamibacteria bacterium]|nr:response regulator [Vicinamibacteria bacterium]
MIDAVMVDAEARILNWATGRMRQERPDVDLRSFTDSADALRAIRERPPQILITDLKMPGLSGLELMMAAREVRPALPVVVTTELPHANLQVELGHSRSIQLIGKPLEFQALSDAITTGVAGLSGGFSGALHLPAISDLIQLCAVAKVSGLIRVHGPGSRRGEMFLDQGAIVHA